MANFADTLFDLSGKTAIVTGASRGIGEAIARRMAQHGANVIVSSRKVGDCKTVADSINAAEGREAAHPVGCNISYYEEIEALVAATTEKFGGVDILVCNAAVNPYYGPSKDITDEQFDKILQCNVKSNLKLAHLSQAEMAKRGGGSIVIISSISGLVGNATLGAYGISKAADLQIARNLAVEYGPSGVRANCIAPGVVKTYFAEALWKDPQVEEMMTKRLPLRRFGEPDDIAGAAVFLASDAGAWMTGQHITIDGGTVINAGGL